MRWPWIWATFGIQMKGSTHLLQQSHTFVSSLSMTPCLAQRCPCSKQFDLSLKLSFNHRKEFLSSHPHFRIIPQFGVIKHYQKRRMLDWCVNTSGKVEYFLLPSLANSWYVIPQRLTYFPAEQKHLKPTIRWGCPMPSLG